MNIFAVWKNVRNSFISFEQRWAWVVVEYPRGLGLNEHDALIDSFVFIV